MLKFQFKDKRRDPFWAMEKTFSIGKSKDNHLVIDDPSVSPHHAKLSNQGDTFLLRDLGSDAGTLVNGQRINQKLIVCGDTITIGSVVLEVIDPMIEAEDTGLTYWSLIADSSWLSGQEFPIVPNEGNSLIIGRGSNCDIIFPGTHLSREHAEVTVGKNALIFRDLNSANGTYVNDKKIKEAKVKPGDRVRLDVYSFKVFGPGIELPKAATVLRAPAVEEFTPLDPNAVKKWKTRPTSPGNREEPSYGKQNSLIAWISGLLLIGLIAAIVYFFLGIKLQKPPYLASLLPPAR